MNHLALFLFLIISFFSTSQTNEKIVAHYNDTIPYYYFKFKGENKTFLWDTISKSNNLSETIFYIKNNTVKDIVVSHTYYKNKYIKWSGGKNRLVKPGGYYELDISIYLSTYLRRIRERLEVYYTIDGIPHTFTLNTSGFYDPNQQKNNYQPQHIDYPISTHTKSNTIHYVYDITNWKNTFDWGKIDTTKSTDMITFLVNNPTLDTLYIRSIDMPYEKIFVEGEINGQIITNRTDVNISLPPKETLIIRTKILAIKEPIYYFHLPNYINVVYFKNQTRQRFRIKNETHIKNKAPKEKGNTKPTIISNKRKNKKKTQRYKTDTKHYYFNFTDLNQNFDWGKVYVSTELDSTLFLIKNNTGEQIIVTHTELKNNLTNWSWSQRISVAPNAYYEVKPHFYSVHYTTNNLKYPLKIKYITKNQTKELIIKTNIDSIYTPQTKEAVLTLKEQHKNRKVKINSTFINRNSDQLGYNYEFDETNYGFNWGDFNPLKNQVANIYITNTSDDTLYISQINNPILNFKTVSYVQNKQIKNKDYGYTAVPPHEKLRVSLFAKATRSYRFKFPFHLTLKYFKNGERKMMKLINSGHFIKPPPIVLVKRPKPPKPILPKVDPFKNYTIQLDLPFIEPNTLTDLVFIRWIGNQTDTIKLKPYSTFTVKVKQNDLIYGMYYCPTYGVIAKINHIIDFTHKTESKKKHFKVIHLFKSRDNYFYAGYGMSYIKQPYKRKENYTYKLTWGNETNDRKAYYKKVINYVQSLGYSPNEFIYEPNLKKAIALEKKLKHSKYNITMEAVDWHHNISPQGWGGGCSIYANHFQIEFLPNVSKEWISSFFNKYQIKNYSVYNNKYTFKFNYTISRSFMRILDRMWMKKEVLKIKQFKYDNPDMD